MNYDAVSGTLGRRVNLGIKIALWLQTYMYKLMQLPAQRMKHFDFYLKYACLQNESER